MAQAHAAIATISDRRQVPVAVLSLGKASRVKPRSAREHDAGQQRVDAHHQG
jgi:hypothetical protein